MTDTMTLHALIDALETAAHGSPELDYAFHRAWHGDTMTIAAPPAYTTDLGVLRALLPPECNDVVAMDVGRDTIRARVGMPGGWSDWARSRTAPLALAATILTAASKPAEYAVMARPLNGTAEMRVAVYATEDEARAEADAFAAQRPLWNFRVAPLVLLAPGAVA